ncbi:hypothetical protein ACER0C_002047 [Sarotherodon galilaeus]
MLSFHCFPKDPELRAQWLMEIRRHGFTVTTSSRVCSRHFEIGDIFVSSSGKRCLQPKVVPSLFHWNNFSKKTERPGVLEHRVKYETISGEIDELRLQLGSYQSTQGLQRFATSPDDIRDYTRFPSYNHLMAFWVLIEPCIYKMIRASRAKSAATTDEEVLTPAHTQTLLQPIDEFFLFLVFLSVGLKERDLAHRFNIHQSTVSRIIATWTSFLATALGSQCIWLTRAEVQAYLPKEFKGFSDTQVILDCTELRCQTPSSPLLQSETYSSYKSHCTMKALVGIAPHGPVTFISDLYAGSVSDKELFKQSGIAEKLTEDMAVMVDKGFLITDCCKCKVYRPPFLSKKTKKKKNQVKETQATVRLRLHVERVIRRIKQNKLFDGIITMSPVYNISQLFAVACMLSNYQNTALVKKQVK